MAIYASPEREEREMGEMGEERGEIGERDGRPHVKHRPCPLSFSRPEVSGDPSLPFGSDPNESDRQQ